MPSRAFLPGQALPIVALSWPAAPLGMFIIGVGWPRLALLWLFLAPLGRVVPSCTLVRMCRSSLVEAAQSTLSGAVCGDWSLAAVARCRC
eukprot:362039-Alexandrium_andersonii.AAC.1